MMSHHHHPPTTASTTTGGGGDGGTTNNKQTKLLLTIRASNLRNVAGTFKGTSDPFAVVTLLGEGRDSKPEVLGKTEVIKNNLNPQWTKTFTLTYSFGQPQHINVGVYDEIRKSSDKPMGSAMFEVGDILGTKGNVKAKKLKRGGILYVRIDRAPTEPTGQARFTFRGVKLKNVEGGLMGKSDPFLEIARQVHGPAGHSWNTVVRTKHVKNNLNPTWETVVVDMDRLCDGDKSLPLKITVWDWEKNGKHKDMGTFETDVNGLLSSRKNGFTLRKKGKDYGTVFVAEAAVTTVSRATPPAAQQQQAAPAVVPVPPPYMAASVPAAAAAAGGAYVPPPGNAFASSAPPMVPIPVPIPSSYAPPPTTRPTFVDYISGGLELQLKIAIDFTGSNGDPRRPNTLHYKHPDGYTLNDYERAITAVGSIVAKYDSDQKFPVWGFGAKYGGILRNCFQVGNSAELCGIDGVLNGYRSVFRTPITMSGPTVFREVIDLASNQAVRKQEEAKRIGQQSYTVLLILTDGAVSDVNLTRNAIAAASTSPLSIVIVGIGTADFGAMRFLDDFETRGGRHRDIVQFVELNAHQHSRASLTRATLEEIPDQVVNYFYDNHGIMPLPKIHGSRLDILPEEHNEDLDIDLALDIDTDGDINLGGNNAGLYVDDGYDTGGATTYAGVTILPPPSAPPGGGGGAYVPGAATPYNPATSSMAAQYNPEAYVAPYNPSAAVPGGGGAAPPPYNPAAPPYQPTGGGANNPRYHGQQQQQPYYPNARPY